jgi:hypothetical protein
MLILSSCVPGRDVVATVDFASENHERLFERVKPVAKARLARLSGLAVVGRRVPFVLLARAREQLSKTVLRRLAHCHACLVLGGAASPGTQSPLIDLRFGARSR